MMYHHKYVLYDFCFQISLDVNCLNASYQLQETVDVNINQSSQQVLVIEWMPNVLQISKFGELKMKFNFCT